MSVSAGSTGPFGGSKFAGGVLGGRITWEPEDPATLATLVMTATIVARANKWRFLTPLAYYLQRVLVPFVEEINGMRLYVAYREVAITLSGPVRTLKQRNSTN
jgi:hypothetical protein